MCADMRINVCAGTCVGICVDMCVEVAQQDAASLGAQEQRSLEALAAALDNEVELTDVTLDSEEHCGEA